MDAPFDTCSVRELFKDGIHYSLYRPVAPVNFFIDHFLVAGGRPLFQLERAFPNNGVELFFNLGDPNIGKLPECNKEFNFSKSIISGLRTSYLEITPGNFFSIAGMRFTLFGFYHLFKIPASLVTNDNFDATDVLGRSIQELQEKISEVRGDTQKLMLLNDWIFSCSQQTMGIERVWNKVDRTLKETNSHIQQSLSEVMGYSNKHTIHLIRQMTGLAPKTVQRIYRINSYLKSTALSMENSWARVAFACGYADQSHFIKEFKTFTGFTPEELTKKNPKDYLLKQLG